MYAIEDQVEEGPGQSGHVLPRRHKTKVSRRWEVASSEQRLSDSLLGKTDVTEADRCTLKAALFDFRVHNPSEHK